MKPQIVRLAVETFSCFSRLINVWTGGSADLTFSARSHVYGLWTERYIDWLFLNAFGEENHCEKWWLKEIYRSERNISLAKALN